MNDSPRNSCDLENSIKDKIAKHGWINYETFTQIALYHTEHGYYVKDKERVGKSNNTDFYTSTSIPVFKELILECIKSLSTKSKYQQFQFIEIGNESKQPFFNDTEDPIVAQKNIGYGNEIALSGSCVVFSNELLDAQPFRRFRFIKGIWHELVIQMANNHLTETPIPTDSVPDFLPKTTTEGYTFDWPCGAENLLRHIVDQEWVGILIFIDYGKMLSDLLSNHPAGTARAYYQHKQSHHLLEHPGDQDLTCHICWDRLQDILSNHGFKAQTLQSQESFFVKEARPAIERILKSPKNTASGNHRGLMELIHPGHLGSKFQVLTAYRENR